MSSIISGHAIAAPATTSVPASTPAEHQIAAFLVALAAVPLLFFAGYWRAVLNRLHPAGRLSANVELAGAVVAATGLCVQALIHAALAEAA